MVATLPALLLGICAVGCERSSKASAKIHVTQEPVGFAKDIGASQSRSDDWPGLLGPRQNATISGRECSFDWPEAGPKVAWRSPLGTGYSAPVAVGQSLIVFHRVADEECIDCLDTVSGERRWRYSYPTQFVCRFEYSNGPYSTPVIAGDRVVAWGAEGWLHCLRLADGEMIWKRQLSSEFDVPKRDFPVAASPLVEGNLLVLNVGGTRGESGMVALDCDTGETRWTATTEPAAYATPVAATIHDRRFVFALGYDHLIALDSANGNIYWQIEFHAKNRNLGKFNATSPLVVEDRVLVSAYAAGTLCVQVLPDGGYRQLWRTSPRNLDSQYTPLIARGTGVFGFASRQRSLTLLDRDTGEVRWSWPSEIGRDAQMFAVEDRLILLGESGQLAIVSTLDAPPTVTSITPQPLLDGPCFATPIVAGSRLFARNEKEVICCDLGKLPGGFPPSISLRQSANE
jgi:outer membrane protein assembly factor BamB